MRDDRVERDWAIRRAGGDPEADKRLDSMAATADFDQWKTGEGWHAR